MADAGLSLIVVAGANLLIGAIALLPARADLFRSSCTLSAVLAFVGGAAMLFFR